MAGTSPDGVTRGEAEGRRLSNTRPRDALGRPLPWDAVGEDMVPERDWIDAADAISEALAYLRAGRPFHAHEVLEQRWRCAADDEREWWRALAQAAAAATQAARGNAVGAERLRTRATATLADLRPPPDLSTDEVATLLDLLGL